MNKNKTINWWKYIKPYLPYFILGPLCMIIEVIGEILMPRLLAYIINLGIDGNTEKVPGIILWLYEKIGNSAYFIVAIAVGMILTALLMMIGGVGGAYFGGKTTNFVQSGLTDSWKLKSETLEHKNKKWRLWEDTALLYVWEQTRLQKR